MLLIFCSVPAPGSELRLEVDGAASVAVDGAFGLEPSPEGDGASVGWDEASVVGT